MYYMQATNRPEGTVRIDLDQLWPMVGVENEDFLKEVTESVRKKGMINPLLIVEISPEEWGNEKAMDNPDILDPPEHFHPKARIFRVQSGNNRYRAARALGMTEIDCLVVSLQQAKEMAKEMRKSKEWRITK